jgi:ferric-dicitrate binding protein FerR (iron transport regulator)
MNPPPDSRSEVHDLCDRLFDGEFTAADRDRLESLVIGHADARRAYIEYVQVHAALSEERLKDMPLSEIVNLVGAPNDDTVEDSGAPRAAQNRPWIKVAMALAASIAVLAAGWGIGRWQGVATNGSPFATLVDAKGARWDGGTLPTEVGAALSQGRLRLAAGLAVLEFRKGARLTLEGPADLELVSADKCFLHRGALTAHVPPPAVGFIVETANASLVDHGTDFGISANGSGAAKVQVFKGEVELQHHVSGERVQLLTRQGASVSAESFSRKSATDDDAEAELPSARQPETRGVNVVTITSAEGRGQAAYAWTAGTKEHFSDTLLLLKHTPSKLPCRRKAWLAFDLSSLQGRGIAEASLSLAFEPTGWGYASLMPDAVFTVYGVTEDALDAWNASDLTWDNAPANDISGSGVEPGKAVKLGSFTMPQGVLEGTFSINTPELAAYLEHDANKLATLVVVRETAEPIGGCVVHGFAGNHHPTLKAPTLRLVMK